MIDEKSINLLKNYYINQNKAIPTNVKAYEADYPKGYGRTAIRTKFNLSCKQLLSILHDNPELSKDINYWVKYITDKFDISVLSVKTNIQIRKSLIEIKCNKCGFIQLTDVENLIARKTSCTVCQSGNAKIKDNPNTLLEALENKKLTLVGKLPDNQLTKILVNCNMCETSFYVLPVKIMHPQTDNTGTCPNCRDSDRRVVYNKETFGSQIERDVFIELQKYVSDIQRQVRYSSLAKCSRRWTMDMLIGNTIIEVSNFSKDAHNDTYYSNLKDKKQWAEDNGFVFIHISKVSEVKTLVKDIVWTVS